MTTWWDRAGYQCRNIPADRGFHAGIPGVDCVKVRDVACNHSLIITRVDYDSMTDDGFRFAMDQHAEHCPTLRAYVERLLPD